MKPNLILYSTEACHLCDEAEAILHNAGLAWQKIDIIEDEQLLQRYGTSIPVLLRADNGHSLNWPFRLHDVLQLVQQ